MRERSKLRCIASRTAINAVARARAHPYIRRCVFCDIRLNRLAFRGTHTIDTLPACGNASAVHKRQFPRQMRRCGGWVVLIMPDDGSYKPPYVGKAAAHRYAKVTHRAQFKWRIPLPPSRIFTRNMFHRVPERASCASNFEYSLVPIKYRRRRLREKKNRATIRY